MILKKKDTRIHCRKTLLKGGFSNVRSTFDDLEKVITLLEPSMTD